MICLGQVTSAHAQTEPVVVTGDFLDEIQQQAKDGNTIAQRKLGLLYLTGQHVTNNPEKGRQWLEKAAENNDVEALKALGRVYADGLGVRENVENLLNIFNSQLRRVTQLQRQS